MKNDPNFQIVSFRCPRKFATHLHSLVISSITKTGTMYTLSDLIRDTLEKTYPSLKELSGHEKNKKIK